MSATVLERAYGIHGVGLVIRAPEPQVIAAMNLRLADFVLDPGPEDVGSPVFHGGLPQVRFEFVQGTAPDPRAGESRPVYDTPYGSLHYFPAADALHGVFAGVTLDCRLARGLATFTSQSFTGRSLYLATHPLATICLMELLERHGLFSLHAACLAGRDGEGVLLAGPSGAGKSTLALALARAGMDFLSDDVVFLTRHKGSGPVRVLGFSDAVGVTEHLATRLRELNGILATPRLEGFPKRLCRIEDVVGAPGLAFCEPRALVFPQVAADRASQLEPLHPSDALVRLVPDVLLTDARATHAHLQAIGSLLDQVACYELRSGRDLERAVTLVRELV